MPYGLFELYKLTSAVVLPCVGLINFVMLFEHLKYKIKKLQWKGKYVRIFYIAENTQISSAICKIGTEYCDQVVEHDGKSFIYDSNMVKFIPKFMGKISSEPMLWYRWDNISAIDTDNGILKALKPFDINSIKNNKLPKEFYEALHTKAITDLFKDDSAIGAKEASIMLIVLIVVGAGFYLLAKNMGWM